MIGVLWYCSDREGFIKKTFSNFSLFYKIYIYIRSKQSKDIYTILQNNYNTLNPKANNNNLSFFYKKY